MIKLNDIAPRLHKKLTSVDLFVLVLIGLNVFSCRIYVL